VDLRQLEIIRAIAETGSFTAAGQKLHVSQSAISRQILLLEDELKEPVFLRVERRIRITPAGESLLQLSHRVFQNLQAVARAAGGDLKDIVKLTVYLTDLGNFALVNEIMATYFAAPYPARAAVGVASLPRAAQVEIDAIMHLE
jgi:reactive intermediate/imine deaminase